MSKPSRERLEIIRLLKEKKIDKENLETEFSDFTRSIEFLANEITLLETLLELPKTDIEK